MDRAEKKVSDNEDPENRNELLADDEHQQDELLLTSDPPLVGNQERSGSAFI